MLMIGSASTMRSFRMTAISLAYTVLIPLPIAASISRMYFTRRSNPLGSTDAA
jgi:hypothetical protein